RTVLEHQPELTGMSLAFEPNALDGIDGLYTGHPYSDATGRFLPYFTNSSAGIQTQMLDMSPGSGKENYYDLPMREGRSIITSPYAYPIDGESILVSTISIPVEKNDKRAGLI